MTADSLALIVGIVLSLGMSYIPGLNVKFAALDGVYKRLIMLALLLTSGAVIYGLACAGWAADFGISLTCDRTGLVQLITAFVLAAIANQTAYQLSPQTQAVKDAKAESAFGLTGYKPIPPA